MKLTLKDLINKTISDLNLPHASYTIEHPADESHGDYSTNVAMVLFSQLKNKGDERFTSPRQLANTLLKEILKQVQHDKKSSVSKVEVAGPGFINFQLSKVHLINELSSILKHKENFGSSKVGSGKTVVIDYSSPNIAKRFSIGHLRSTIIGQAIYNTYSFLGWETIGDNHLGDWGTQFGVLIYMVEKNELKSKDLSVEDWESLYVDFHKKLDETPELKDEARNAFKRLEEGDIKAREIWQAAFDASIKEYKKIYKKLDVTIDYAYGESFYEDKMKSAIQKAIKKGVAVKSESALAVNFDKYNLPSNILVKSNGTTTYLARDLALMFFRKKQWNPDLQIFEVGEDQKLYFKQVFAMAEMMGLFTLDQLKHIAHGMVRLKGGKMSTRKGKTIKLEDVLNEAIDRAKSFNSDDDTAEMVGVGAIKWNDLKREPTSSIIFDWDEVLNMQGNSGPYIQYTHARCKSVFRKADDQNVTKSKPYKLQATSYKLNPEELAILRFLPRFPEVVERAASEYSPHHICSYLYELAQRYNSFYNKHSILGIDNSESSTDDIPTSQASQDDTTHFRLKLTEATAQVLINGLKLLGIKAPEKM